jgi:hypothetical protein
MPLLEKLINQGVPIHSFARQYVQRQSTRLYDDLASQ